MFTDAFDRTAESYSKLLPSASRAHVRAAVAADIPGSVGVKRRGWCGGSGGRKGRYTVLKSGSGQPSLSSSDL